LTKGENAVDGAVERSAMRKIYWRLLPFLVLTYLLAYVDRINVGFAALTMRSDLHMTATQFGFASGIFFWGYFLFEVPSNIILEKVGARLWIARIMISWGILAAAAAFATGAQSFAIIRFLLGLAEAGFFPGVILYFTYWFPHYHQPPAPRPADRRRGSGEGVRPSVMAGFSPATHDFLRRSKQSRVMT
jgi:MFS transporter, ACS family, tartrate transporter